jgi:hypothetical protein
MNFVQDRLMHHYTNRLTFVPKNLKPFSYPLMRDENAPITRSVNRCVQLVYTPPEEHEHSQQHTERYRQNERFFPMSHQKLLLSFKNDYESAERFNFH